jgi:hypothetical protein
MHRRWENSRPFAAKRRHPSNFGNCGGRCEIAIDIDEPEPLIPGEPVTLRFSLTPRPTYPRGSMWIMYTIGNNYGTIQQTIPLK